MKLLLTSLIVFCSSSLHAGNYSVKDSIRLDEVVVTGTRSEVNLRHLPMSVSTIKKKQIEQRYEPSLLPLLSEAIPGMFVTGRGIMGYGVADGAAGGMSIRGIGSNNQAGGPTTGLLILIDGHPQYMGLMGHPIADAYQSGMTERVEVVRGPASILYGSNAMGGVVNIITRKQQYDAVYTHARLMYGSYNTANVGVNNSVRSGRFSSFASLDYNRTDGHRADMDFNQYNTYAKLGYDFTTHWKAFADVNLTNFESSNPGAVSAPIIDNDADITRGMTSFSLENNYERSSGALKLFYNWGIHRINGGYTPGTAPKDYLFRSFDKMLGVTLYQSYRLFAGNQTTAGLDYQHFGGHAWNQFPDKEKELADQSLDDVAGYLTIQQTVGNALTFNLGMRADYNDHFGLEWVPQAGITFTPSGATTLKAIVSKGFRNPTIREMYMFPPQNPDLQPERLMNYEVSASHYLLDNALLLNLNLFYIEGDNMIQTLPVDGKMKNVNTGTVENYGIELAAGYQLTSQLNLSANYSWLHMKHKVVASPEHKLYVGADYSYRRWKLSTGMQYVAGLYTSVREGKESTENFALWNLRATYRLDKAVDLFVRGENLLAQKYEINIGYPMPRATFFAGANVKF